MAREMIARALDAGISCAWVLADPLYGSDYRLRRMLEDRGQPYVLAVRSNQHLRFLTEEGLVQTDPAFLAEELEAGDWQALPAGEGTKGPRLYHWARLPLNWTTQDGFERWLLFRRSLRKPDEIAYYFAHARQGTSLEEVAGAAGLRWTIEECFLRARDDLGLDHCEARSWHGWHRHMTLVMAAAAFLAKLAADQRRAAWKQTRTKTDCSSKQDKTSPNKQTVSPWRFKAPSLPPKSGGSSQNSSSSPPTLLPSHGSGHDGDKPIKPSPHTVIVKNDSIRNCSIRRRGRI
jgi:SRSO17 transposase